MDRDTATGTEAGSYQRVPVLFQLDSGNTMLSLRAVYGPGPLRPCGPSLHPPQGPDVRHSFFYSQVKAQAL